MNDETYEDVVRYSEMLCRTIITRHQHGCDSLWGCDAEPSCDTAGVVEMCLDRLAELGLMLR